MRRVMLLAAASLGQPALAEDKPSMDIHLDVPQDKGAQHVNVLLREFPVGGSSGWHTHAGAEIAYLVSGEMTLEQAGQPTRRLIAGDSFIVSRDVPHNGSNVGKGAARLVITYVYDRGAPLRSPVPGPQSGH